MDLEGKSDFDIESIRRQEEVPAVVVDQQGLITYVNKRFQEIFGWKPQDIVGKTLSTIIPPYLHDAHNLGFSRFLVTGRPSLLNRPLALKAVTKEGREFPAEHFIVAERREEEWVFAALIRPVEPTDAKPDE